VRKVYLLDGLRDLSDLPKAVFGGYREPFTHSQIVDFLAAIKSLGLKHTTSNSGVALKAERARALVDRGFDGITVSLDGTTEQRKGMRWTTDKYLPHQEQAC